MPPPAAGESASAVKAQVQELIDLIDKLLLIKGATVTRRGGLRSPGTMPPPSRDDVPVALHLFADVTVPSLVAQDNLDLASFEDICARATALMSSSVITTAANVHLCDEFAKVSDSAHERTVFAGYKVPDQVYQLRFRRQQVRESQVQTFSLIVVTSISPGGLPQSYSTTFHPVEVSWPNFLIALTNASICWQTAFAGFDTGYTTEHGRWFYQATRNGHELDILKPMTSSADFERMRAELRVPDTWVVVWHERTLDLSLRLRREAEAFLKQHNLRVPQADQAPFEQELPPHEGFRPKGTDEMWAHLRRMQGEADERENSEIIGRFIEYDRQNPLFPEEDGPVSQQNQ